MPRKANHIILGIHLQDRFKQASEVQRLFTEYGCQIKTRIGMHEVSDDFCAVGGVILLEMFGPPAKAGELVRKLRKLDNIEVQKLVFRHE